MEDSKLMAKITKMTKTKKKKEKKKDFFGKKVYLQMANAQTLFNLKN